MRFKRLIGILLLFACCGGLNTTLSADLLDFEAVCRAVEDLQNTYGDAYPISQDTLNALREAHSRLPETIQVADTGDNTARELIKTWRAQAQAALLSNPLLAFDRVLLIRRSANQLGLPQNWESNSSLPLSGFDNEIIVFSIAEGSVQTLYRPAKDVFVGDLSLHWDAEKLLFSMPGSNGRWQVHEFYLPDRTVRELPLIYEPDVDNYEACYLPDDNVIFASTAPFVGVPCVTGASHVSNVYRYDVAEGTIRRLTFEQDHNWCPRVLSNGRILYLRWEYSDIPHFASRILFHMNPDGTGQMEYYGSNSYWPNAMFYARPIPGHPTKFIAIVGGHHGVPRMGELVIFDPALGRHEASGVIKRIPGFGRPVEPVIKDNLVDNSWPRFLHPYPLSEHYFLVSCQPSPRSLWGLYLVDIFDNMVLLREEEGYALFEPIPLVPTPRPPIIPARVNLERNDATVVISDIYVGDGLKNIPRGTIKKLRLFTYHFAYHGMGGQINRVGLDGPWDIKRVLGTVPVEPDGSAYFTVPANTPLSLQPLDENGQAVQLMRSWMTAMPGEVVSCVGCHESQNTSVPVRLVDAPRRTPTSIEPWYGPVRGFSFRREVQPVLDTYCVECHNGDGNTIPDFRDLPDIETQPLEKAYRKGSKFPPAYLALRQYVRGHTMESDLHLLPPMEFHASTTELVQHLRAGHKGIVLDAESWDRLITWIDLNTPAHGTWKEIVGCEKVEQLRQRRIVMQQRYAQGADGDPELIYDLATKDRIAAYARPREYSDTITEEPPDIDVSMDYSENQERREIALPSGLSLVLVKIPAGTWQKKADPLSSDTNYDRETRINAFWMSSTEITNAQYGLFDPEHDSRLEHGDFLQFSPKERGWPLNEPDQPVVRVSWNQARAFCAWLSTLTGETFSLPTAEQWEHACRAGVSTEMWYGSYDTDFSSFENLADRSFNAVETFVPWMLPSGAIHPWRLARTDVNDGYRVSAPVGRFMPNPWGLYDMHGNVAEWTCTPEEKASDLSSVSHYIVCGGSWADRPHRANVSARRLFAPWQGIYNVGFRVIALIQDVT